MRAKFYKVLTKLCSAIGWVGEKIKFWAEFKEWEYWNDKKCKIIDMPNDVKVFLWYNRRGEYLEIHVDRWPLVEGRYEQIPILEPIRLTEKDILKSATEESIKGTA